MLVVFIAYSRFDQIENNLEIIGDNHKLIIYIDGARSKKVETIQSRFISRYKNKCQIVTRSKNIGVKKHIPMCISESFKLSNELIILEDDISINNSSIKFVAESFTNNEVQMVSLFNPNSDENNSSFFSRVGGIWGWAIKKEIWDNFSLHKQPYNKIFMAFYSRLGLLYSLFFTPSVYLSLNDKICSWAYPWLYNRVNNDIYSLLPNKSLSKNIGINDAFATNCNKGHKHSKVNIHYDYILNKPITKLDQNLTKVTGYSLIGIILRIFYYNYLVILHKIKK